MNDSHHVSWLKRAYAMSIEQIELRDMEDYRVDFKQARQIVSALVLTGLKEDQNLASRLIEQWGLETLTE